MARTETQAQYTLGTGILTWDAHERRTDRYGSVWLYPESELNDDPMQEAPAPLALCIPDALPGQVGQLVAHIQQARKSPHIGDLFRRIFPATPSIGERFVLGTGTLFTTHDERVGVQPDDGREDDWLDPRLLYRCHHQTVTLVFLQA